MSESEHEAIVHPINFAEERLVDLVRKSEELREEIEALFGECLLFDNKKGTSTDRRLLEVLVGRSFSDVHLELGGGMYNDVSMRGPVPLDKNVGILVRHGVLRDRYIETQPDDSILSVFPVPGAEDAFVRHSIQAVRRERLRLAELRGEIVDTVIRLHRSCTKVGGEPFFSRKGDNPYAPGFHTFNPYEAGIHTLAASARRDFMEFSLRYLNHLPTHLQGVIPQALIQAWEGSVPKTEGFRGLEQLVAAAEKLSREQQDAGGEVEEITERLCMSYSRYVENLLRRVALGERVKEHLNEEQLLEVALALVDLPKIQWELQGELKKVADQQGENRRGGLSGRMRR